MLRTMRLNIHACWSTAIRSGRRGSTSPISGRKARWWYGRRATWLPCHRDYGLLRSMPPSSRHSRCMTIAAVQTCRSAGRFFIQGRLSPHGSSSHRFDDLRELVEYLADLIFAHDQWWAERQCVADGAKHDVMLEEAHFEGLHAALAGTVGFVGEVNSDREPDRPDVENVWQPLQSHGGLGPW